MLLRLNFDGKLQKKKCSRLPLAQRISSISKQPNGKIFLESTTTRAHAAPKSISDKFVDLKRKKQVSGFATAKKNGRPKSEM